MNSPPFVLNNCGIRPCHVSVSWRLWQIEVASGNRTVPCPLIGHRIVTGGAWGIAIVSDEAGNGDTASICFVDMVGSDFGHDKSISKHRQLK